MNTEVKHYQRVAHTKDAIQDNNKGPIEELQRNYIRLGMQAVK